MILRSALFLTLTLVSVSVHAASGKYVVVVGMASEAKVARGPNVIVITGAMREAQLRAKLAALETTDVLGVISFGVAGGLDEKLAVGDLIIPDRVIFAGQTLPTSPELNAIIIDSAKAKGLSFHSNTGLVGTNAFDTGTTDVRTKLREATGAGVVDMESHIAAEFAASRRLPFAVVRVLSDTVGDVMPPAALEELDENGEVQVSRVLRSIGRNPLQIRELIKTARNFQSAMKTLKTSREALDFLFGRNP